MCFLFVFLNPSWSASSCLKWSLNTSYPSKRNIRVSQGKLTLGRTHKLIPPLWYKLRESWWNPFPELLICCSISKRFFLLWRAFDLLYKMRYILWGIFFRLGFAWLSSILPTPLVFISGYANTENVFYCLNIIEDLQFGVEWQGWWLVDVTPSFRWENAHYIYQMVGLGSTNFFRNLGITCSLYTNDRIYGESFATEDYWSRPSIEQDEFRFVRRTYVYCPSWLFP